MLCADKLLCLKTCFYSFQDNKLTGHKVHIETGSVGAYMFFDYNSIFLKHEVEWQTDQIQFVWCVTLL